MLNNIFIGILLIIFLLTTWFALGRILQEHFALLRTNYLISIPLGMTIYFLSVWITSLPFIFLASGSLPLFLAILIINVFIVVYIVLNYKKWFHKYINYRTIGSTFLLAVFLIIIYYFLWPLRFNYQNEDFIGLINNNIESNNLFISFQGNVVSKFNAYYLWVAMLVRFFNFDIAFLTNWILNILFLIMFVFFSTASISIVIKNNKVAKGMVVVVLFLIMHFLLTIFPWGGTFICFNLLFLAIAFYIRYLLSSFRNRYYLIIASMMSTIALNFSNQIIYVNFVIFFIIMFLIIFRYKNNFILDFMITFFSPCISLAFLFFNVGNFIGWTVLILFFSFLLYVIFIYYWRSEIFKKLENSIYEDRYLVVSVVPIILFVASIYLFILDRHQNEAQIWNADYFFHFKNHLVNWIAFISAWIIEIVFAIYIIIKGVRKTWVFNKNNILILWLFISILIILNPLLQIFYKRYFSTSFNYQIMLWVIIIPSTLIFLNWIAIIKKINLLVAVTIMSATLSSIIVINAPKINYQNYNSFTLVNKGVQNIAYQMKQYMDDPKNHMKNEVRYLGDYNWINVYFHKGVLVKDINSQFVNNVFVDANSIDGFKDAIAKIKVDWIIKLKTNIDNSIIAYLKYNIIIQNDFYYVFAK